MLELPPTIRLAFEDELPKNSAAFELWEKSKTASIIEGFKIEKNTSLDLPFKFYAEINIDNSRLWQLFSALAKSLPDEVSCVYNFYDGEARFSPYLKRDFMLAELGNFRDELIRDCYFEFGLIFESDELLEEVFVNESKYLSFWGNDEDSFRDLMRKFSLTESSTLNFIDEFPKVIEPLVKFDNSALRTEILFERLNALFQNNAET